MEIKNLLFKNDYMCAENEVQTSTTKNMFLVLFKQSDKQGQFKTKQKVYKLKINS